MSKKVYDNVLPIFKGFNSTITIKFSSDFWTAYNIGGEQLAVTFNDTIDEVTPLWVGSTANGAITRNSTDKTVRITIPQSVTATWDMDYVRFDIFRYQGSAKTAIPGVWTWPVSKRVGVNVPS